MNCYSSESKRMRKASLNLKHSPTGLRLSWIFLKLHSKTPEHKERKQRYMGILCLSDSSDSSYWSNFPMELFILLPHWINIRLGCQVKVRDVLSQCSSVTPLPWEQPECAWLATLWLLKHAWLCKSSVQPGMSLSMPPQKKCTNKNTAATTSQQQQHHCWKGYKLCTVSHLRFLWTVFMENATTWSRIKNCACVNFVWKCELGCAFVCICAWILLYI